MRSFWWSTYATVISWSFWVLFEFLMFFSFWNTSFIYDLWSSDNSLFSIFFWLFVLYSLPCTRCVIVIMAVHFVCDTWMFYVRLFFVLICQSNFSFLHSYTQLMHFYHSYYVWVCNLCVQFVCALCLCMYICFVNTNDSYHFVKCDW